MPERQRLIDRCNGKLIGTYGLHGFSASSTVTVCVCLSHTHHFDTAVKLGLKRLYVVADGRKINLSKPIYPGDMRHQTHLLHAASSKSAIGCSSSASEAKASNVTDVARHLAPRTPKTSRLAS